MARPLSRRVDSWRDAQDSQTELRAEWQAAVAQNAASTPSNLVDIEPGPAASPNATGGDPGPRDSDAPPNLSRLALRVALPVSGRHAPAISSTVPNTVIIRRQATPGATVWPLTRIVCDAMRLDAIVVQGVSVRALARGPGHDPQTSPPGGANCVIAAHRNMAGWWFYHLGRLRAGDQILLETPRQKFDYRVQALNTVPGDDLAPLRPAVAGPRLLTLYSCTLPKTTRRLVATALLKTGA